MAFRELRIKNYRNIGISEEQSLLLNTSIENGELGSLVFLVGPNNSGKSNCLDALLSLGNEHSLSQQDSPDFSTTPLETEIQLVVRDKDIKVGSKTSLKNQKVENKLFYKKNGVTKTKFKRQVELGKQDIEFAEKLFVSVPYEHQEEINYTINEKKLFIWLLNTIANSYGNNVLQNKSLFPDGSYSAWYNKARRNLYPEDIQNADKIALACINYIEKRIGQDWKRKYISNLRSKNVVLDDIIKKLTSKYDILKSPILASSRELLSTYQEASEKSPDRVDLSDYLKNQDKTKEIKNIIKYAIKLWGKDYYTTKLGFNISESDYLKIYEKLTTKIEEVSAPEIIEWENNKNLKVNPKIVVFKETKIAHKSLIIKPSELKSSQFFTILLKAIDYDQIELLNLFEDVKTGKKVTRMLRVVEDNLNEKLETINDQFNRLFFLKDEKYTFRLLLETDKIEFSLNIGKLPLNLDRQSTGFKWFFNFYFTVIAQKDLSRGDIIIMDEPATNLHVSGIRELREFMKDYAKRSELTFLISTHSPFFVDVDNLEEVRVVSRKNNEAVINNKFQVIEEDDTDALRPIKDALTVGRHIILNPENKTIFVEGMTDYCYLTAIKQNCPDLEQNIHFLPIQGLKKSNLLDRVMKIEKYPTILVDNDKYGKSVRDQANSSKYRDRVEVITLSEIDASYKTIESLFAEEDCPNDKEFETAVSFKNAFNAEKLNDNTVYNFRKLFKNISS